MKNSPYIVILGGGVSGKSAQKLASALKIKSRIIDDRDADAVIPDEATLIVASPGVHPLKSRLYHLAKASGKELISELEFALRNFDLPYLAVTGTNGKTTTTEVANLILNKMNFKSMPCGNIGMPLSEIAAERIEGNLVDLKTVVIEVSSFQLELTSSLAPASAALLNLASDHIDRYEGGFKEYCEVKKRIFANVPQKNCVYGASFGKKPDYSKSISIDRDYIVIDGEKVCKISESALNSPHNRENLLSASQMVLNFLGDKFDRGAFAEAVLEYKPGAHRIEVILQKNNICFIDDSKATNPASVLAAAASRNEKIVLIAGGLGKGIDFSPLALIADKLRAVVLIGESRHAIAEVFRNKVPCSDCETNFDLAVRTAVNLAEKGDCVMLSPACASMDMFKNYEERGRIFAETVKKYMN
jgi:UDP-N-acetylmuramoylalanine--D-glutamate ligase